jgi:hypothetical protein
MDSSAAEAWIQAASPWPQSAHAGQAHSISVGFFDRKVNSLIDYISKLR